MPILSEADARQVVTHLTHIEDLPITKQYAGAKEAIEFLKKVSDVLSGHAPKSFNLRVKIDGSPSVVVGIDPADSAFFVGTKGALAKTPKVAKSLEEVQSLYADKPGLVEVMSTVFTALQDMDFPNILQGDVLFIPSMKRNQNIEGKEYVTFKPNTITYGVPTDSKLGKHIENATLGICFHTTYTGSALQSLVGRSGADIKRLSPPDNVVLISNEYQDLSGTVTFTRNEMAEMNRAMTTAQRLTDGLSDNQFVTLMEKLPLLRTEFNIFQNSLVRKGESITLTPQTFGNQFLLFMKVRRDKLAGQRKTSKGMEEIVSRYETLNKAVASLYEDVVKLLAWQQAIITIKKFMLDKLDNPTDIATFYDTDAGLVAGPHEGFVAADRNGNFVKLVNRDHFTRLNMNYGRFAGGNTSTL